jgi:hypothetical protein
LAGIRQDFDLHRTCDGHLVERLGVSPYASRFRQAILAATVERNRPAATGSATG